MKARDLTIDEIHVGNTVDFDRTFTEKDVEAFAALSGDMNPLHIDSSYAATTQFKKRVVHGMLVSALCSHLVGMRMPGKRCLYLKQNLSFKLPVFIGDTVKVIGSVTSVSKSTGIVSLSISIQRGDVVVVEGEAVVQVL